MMGRGRGHGLLWINAQETLFTADVTGDKQDTSPLIVPPLFSVAPTVVASDRASFRGALRGFLAGPRHRSSLWR